MWHQPNIVGLARGGDLLELRNTANVGDGRTGVVDQVVLDELVPVPLGSELLANRDWHFYLTTQRLINARIFAADQIFYEVRSQRLNHIRQRDGVWHVEFRVEVNAPATVAPNTFAHLFTEFVYPVDVIEAVHRGALLIRGNPICPETSFHAGFRHFFGCPLGGVPGGVTFHIIAGLATKKLIDRDSERLTLQIPERHIEGAQGVGLFPSGRIEIRTIHGLPQAVGTERVFADQKPRALLHGVARAAFPNTDEAGIGFHKDHIGALVEQGLFCIGTPRSIGGGPVVADPRDLGFWQTSGVGLVG